MGHLWTRLFKHRDVRILLLGKCDNFINEIKKIVWSLVTVPFGRFFFFSFFIFF